MRSSLFSAHRSSSRRLSFSSTSPLSFAFLFKSHYYHPQQQQQQQIQSQWYSYRFMSSNMNNNNNENAGSMTVQTPRTALPPSDFPERSFLKCIEKEIQDETLRLDKEEGPPTPPGGWELYHAPGTSIFYGRRYWIPPTQTASKQEIKEINKKEKIKGKDKERKEEQGNSRMVERHTIRVQLTSRDPSLDPECDVRGEHFPFSLFVQHVLSHNNNNNNNNMTASSSSYRIENMEEEERDLYEDSIEIRADFVDGELIIDNVVFHGTFKPSRGINSSGESRIDSTASTPSSSSSSASHQQKEQLEQDEQKKETKEKTNKDNNDGEMPEVVHYTNVCGGYPGPNLDEAEEEVLDGIQAWLAERCVDDQFGEFVGQYSVWVEQQEYELWLRQLRDFVAA